MKTATASLSMLAVVFGAWLALRHPGDRLPPKAAAADIAVRPVGAARGIPPVKAIDLFETDKDVRNWIGRHGEPRGVIRQRSEKFASQGRCSMAVYWRLTRWGELVLLHFPQDWKGYAAFAFDVYHPGKGAFDLELRIGHLNDHLKLDPALSRYAALRTVRPGLNRLSFSVNRIGEKVPVATGRKIIRLRVLDRNRLFYIDNMRLER